MPKKQTNVRFMEPGSGDAKGLGWWVVPHTPVYASATSVTFTTSTVSDQDPATYLRKYQKFAWNEGATQKFGNILSVATSVSGTTRTTTVALIPNSDYSVSNTTLSVPLYATSGGPFGFPVMFTWPCVPTGFSTPPTSTLYRYCILDGGLLFVKINELGNGTSNNATHTYPLPAGLAAKTITNMAHYGACGLTDSGIAGGLAQYGVCRVVSGDTAITAYTSVAQTGWTSGGALSRALYLDLEFELA